jgi:hypothetical protein
MPVEQLVRSLCDTKQVCAVRVVARACRAQCVARSCQQDDHTASCRHVACALSCRLCLDGELAGVC